RCDEQEICEIRARYAAIKREISVRRARIAFIDLQIAELTAKLDRVSASRFRKSVGDVPGVVWLKRRQRIHAEGEVVEVYRRHGLWKSSGAGGDDAQRSWSGFKPEIREFCEAATRLVRVRSCPEEAQAKLIYRAGAESFVVTEDDLLCTGFRDAGKA